MLDLVPTDSPAPLPVRLTWLEQELDKAGLKEYAFTVMEARDALVSEYDPTHDPAVLAFAMCEAHDAALKETDNG